MDWGYWLRFLVFAVAAFYTPGPNNAMLAASGANFGARRTTPHMVGIVVGFPVMFVAAGFGLSAVFERVWWLHGTLGLLGVCWMVWLGWRIATTGRAGMKRARGALGERPMRMWEAALFQWMNPKGWSMVFATLGVLTTRGGDVVRETLLVGGLFVLLGLGSALMWVEMGVLAGKWLEGRPMGLRVFNGVMGGGVILAALWVLWTWREGGLSLVLWRRGLRGGGNLV